MDKGRALPVAPRISIVIYIFFERMALCV